MPLKIEHQHNNKNDFIPVIVNILVAEYLNSQILSKIIGCAHFMITRHLELSFLVTHKEVPQAKWRSNGK